MTINVKAFLFPNGRDDYGFLPRDPIKETLDRKANQALRPSKPQIPCDEGLFSNTKDQLDLADMPMFQD